MSRYFNCLFSIVLTFLCCIISFSCTTKVEPVLNNLDSSVVQTKATINQETYDSYRYYSESCCWIKPQEDPYKLSNFERAADKYYTDYSGEPATRITISPTHYALTVYPKTEVEFNQILSKDSIKVSYVPFGYTMVSDAEASVSLLGQENRRTFRQYENPNEGMPVMYVVWPIGLPLPETIDYRIEYEAYIPDYSNNNSDVDIEDLFGIEQEAIALANPNVHTTRGQASRTLYGIIKNYDNTLDADVPVNNLKIRVQYGLNIIDNYTLSNGLAVLSGNINDNATVYVVYENDKWRLSRLGSLFAYSLPLGSVSDLWPSDNIIYSPALTHYYLIAHRAANYFFNENNFITIPSYNYSLRINMNEQTSGNNTYFTFLLNSPYIELSAFNTSSGALFRTTTAMLAYFYYYLEKGSNYTTYDSIAPIIKGSFSELLAWYFSREYYIQKNNGIYISIWNNWTYGSNQGWRPNITNGEYSSPMFVDLIDDYNQNSVNQSYNYDIISGMPFTMVKNYGLNYTSWNSFKAHLQDEIGYYFTQDAYDQYIIPYDQYFSQN